MCILYNITNIKSTINTKLLLKIYKFYTYYKIHKNESQLKIIDSHNSCKYFFNISKD